MHAVLPHLRASASPHAQMMRFLLLTLARRDEAATATWSNVNLGAATWTITETKNGQPHVVPLSRQAVALLVGLERVSRTSWCSARGRARSWATGIVTPRRYRRPAGQMDGPATICAAPARPCSARMGELPDIIEAALNHVNPLPAGRDIQPQPLPAPGGGSAATAGGCAGWDRGGSREGGAAARRGLR